MTPTFLGKTTARSGPNSLLRWLIAQVLDLITSGFIDYHPNANRKWCVGEYGRGHTLLEASVDAWRKRI